MKALRFEWDGNKGDTNLRKHGVSFAEASTVFYDPNALIIDDPDHSQTEARFILLGISEKLRMLVVVHCFREVSGAIRIITARKATRFESRQYGRR